jgi:hypothetical protein
MEMWACKRYSKEHPGACVEPAKIKVVPLTRCEDILKRELARQETMFRRKVMTLEKELDKLKKGKK